MAIDPITGIDDGKTPKHLILLEDTGPRGAKFIDTRFTTEQGRVSVNGFDLINFGTQPQNIEDAGPEALLRGPVIEREGKFTPVLGGSAGQGGDLRPFISGFTPQAQEIFQNFLPSGGGFTDLGSIGLDFLGPVARESGTGQATSAIPSGAPGGGTIGLSPEAKTLGVQKSPAVLAEERRRRSPSAVRSNLFTRSGISGDVSSDLLGQKTILG